MTPARGNGVTQVVLLPVWPHSEPAHRQSQWESLYGEVMLGSDNDPFSSWPATQALATQW